MASIEEVKNAALQMMDQLQGIRGNLEGAQINATEISGTAVATLQGSGREDAAAALARMRSGIMNIDDAMANFGIAIEQLEQVIGAL